ncbi:hypothetical protein [Alloyangia mangrovi]|nr:hypothetical protein [Alloyangia mangrovi]
MRELLARGDFLGCISEAQAVAEISHGTLQRLDVAGHWSNRPIGLTLRADWVPTQAQHLMLDKIVEVAGLLHAQ